MMQPTRTGEPADAARFPTEKISRQAAGRRTHSLVKPTPHCWRLQVGLHGYALGGLFMVIGIAMAIGYVITGPHEDWRVRYGLPVVCAGLALGGIATVVFATTVEFDKGFGRLRMRTVAWGAWQDRPLQTLRGIQLIDHGPLGKGRFACELNLVLADPERPRINVCTHPDTQWAIATGSALAEFLGVPFADQRTRRDT